MSITLPPELEQELKAEVAARRAKSVEAFVHQAVRAQLRTLDALRRSLDEASEEVRRGGGYSFEEIRADLDELLRKHD